jgi:tetratricopeptide (TPR) repeat protein
VYRKAVELNPNDSGSWYGIAWILSVRMEESRRDPAAAVKAARKAIDLATKRDRCWRIAGLGAALLRAGEPKKAVKCLEEAIALQKDASKIAMDRLLLAMAQWKCGEKESARATLRRAVAWIDANNPRDMDYAGPRAEAEALLQGEQD